jgi:hypothetical protein
MQALLHIGQKPAPRLLVQQLGEHVLAIETLAAIELVDADRDGSPQGRELLLLLLIEGVRSWHGVSPLAEPSMTHL